MPICARCSGQGFVVCIKCGGQGTLKDEQLELLSGALPDLNQCPDCKGAGKIACPDCEASGETIDDDG